MMKLFISYCHADKEYVSAFCKHLAPLKKQRLVSVWYDKMIYAGDKFDDSISNQMDASNIIIFFISSDFLASDSCQLEVDKSIALREEKGTRLMPVIIHDCDWKSSKLGDLKLQACPEDGKAVSSHGNKNRAWMHVINKIREIIKNEKELARKFKDFMEDPGDFVNDRHTNIHLQDIYVSPDLSFGLTSEDDDNIVFPDQAAEHVLGVDKIKHGSMILICGEDMSGKTALCKNLCREYWHSEYVPVYIKGGNVSNDNLSQIEKTAFKEQYSALFPHDIPDERKIIIFDDFASDNVKVHDVYSLVTLIKKKGYHAAIFVANSLNGIFYSMTWHQSVIDYGISTYVIKKAGHKKRAEIIDKWLLITARPEGAEELENLADPQREHINSLFLGGMLPSYPPYIIMVLGNLSALTTKDEKMSSYGHCYNAIITRHLVDAGVSSDSIGTYFQVLTHIAYYMYEQGQDGNFMSIGKINDFFEEYEKKFILMPGASKVKDTLFSSRLFDKDLYNIKMPDYAFYYFVGKYIANNFDQDLIKKEIEYVFSMAHKRHYGSTLLFIVHHMPRHQHVLNLLNEEINNLFSELEEARLTCEETKALCRVPENLTSPDELPNPSPSKVSGNLKKTFDTTEQKEKDDSELSRRAENEEDYATISISRAFRMMTISGTILKNEHGAMDRESLTKLVTSVRGMSLRITWMIHRIIEMEDVQGYFKGYLENKLSNWGSLTKEQRQQKILQFIDTIAIVCACAMIERCSESIGAGPLMALVDDKIKEEGDSPAYELLHFAVNVSHEKSLDLEYIRTLSERYKSNIFATRILQHIIIAYLHLHAISTSDRQKLSSILKLGIQLKEQEVIGYNRMKKGEE